ncbi:Ala-tRNA(Pro) hydrolase [Burkholderia sp. Leaf177]|uniref:alanyl-tRNA editing protein n=1 Tax=Burkholderia sp. Leaf177 TaxID=1736287 RepID=UPI0006F2E3E2|nr:alanyl-tRNA editing protein [Burkholderia sp. Leaf177]KQR82446.1 Ala-tRNA(Pro) hydrolase [Burkholderia sp. Leaf177]
MRHCEAHVIRADSNGLLLDQTVFYPRGGGQAGDTGYLILDDGTRLRIADTRLAIFDGAGPDEALHIPDQDQDSVLERFVVGQRVHAQIDWERRYRHMRLHTAAHLLCSIVPFPIDGCSITAEHARLDFVTTDTLSRDSINAALAELVEKGAMVSTSTMSDETFEANAELVRTMNVKPPAGTGRVRLVIIDGTDLQPCGGTHVASTSEVGVVRVAKMEKKTARTRRVVLALD